MADLATRLYAKAEVFAPGETADLLIEAAEAVVQLEGERNLLRNQEDDAKRQLEDLNAKQIDLVERANNFEREAREARGRGRGRE